MNNAETINIAIKSIQSGNSHVFEALYKEYYPKLCAFLMGYTDDSNIVEDVVQDVFIKIWKKRKKLNINTSITGYIYKTAYNELMQNHRHLKKNNEMLSAYYYTALVNAIETKKDLKKKQLEDLNMCIEDLPERCKHVFIENKISGLKYKEVADKFNISLKTVEGHISRAIKMLKDCMGSN